MLLVRPPDILIFMQTTRDIATCMYYTGIDPFTKQFACNVIRVFAFRGLDRIGILSHETYPRPAGGWGLAFLPGQRAIPPAVAAAKSDQSAFATAA